MALNSTSGDADALTRKRFDEPAWNYPVMRILDGEGKNLMPRVANRWNMAGMTFALTEGLKAAEAKVPAWLDLLDQEARAKQAGVSTAVFGMT